MAEQSGARCIPEPVKQRTATERCGSSCPTRLASSPAAGRGRVCVERLLSLLVIVSADSEKLTEGTGCAAVLARDTGEQGERCFEVPS